jgi:hypothetical protein
MDDAPQMQGHSEGFEVLAAAADWFLNPKPATLSEQRFQELKQKLNDIRNPQSAAEVLDIPRSFSPAEGLGKAAAGALELYRQLLASERRSSMRIGSRTWTDWKSSFRDRSGRTPREGFVS